MDRAKANKTLEAGETDQIIAEEFERLRESQLFLRSPVLSRLLQYLVEHRLRGGRSAPKAYAIATEALGRNADFDPAVDSYPCAICSTAIMPKRHGFIACASHRAATRSWCSTAPHRRHVALL